MKPKIFIDGEHASDDDFNLFERLRFALLIRRHRSVLGIQVGH